MQLLSLDNLAGLGSGKTAQQWDLEKTSDRKHSATGKRKQKTQAAALHASVGKPVASDLKWIPILESDCYCYCYPSSNILLRKTNLACNASGTEGIGQRLF